MKSKTPLLDRYIQVALCRGDLIAAGRWGAMRSQATPSFRVLDARYPIVNVKALAA